jgi:hypothetical protein
MLHCYTIAIEYASTFEHHSGQQIIVIVVHPFHYIHTHPKL